MIYTNLSQKAAQEILALPSITAKDCQRIVQQAIEEATRPGKGEHAALVKLVNTTVETARKDAAGAAAQLAEKQMEILQLRDLVDALKSELKTRDAV